MEVIQQRQGRSRRSSGGAPGKVSPAVRGERSYRLALVLLLVALLSAVGNLASLVVLAATMGQADSAQGPLTFLPAFGGALIGIVGDLILVRGTLGVIRPGGRFAGGRGLVTVGLLLQLPAAAAAGTLEALLPLTVAYVLVLAALAALWLRSAPAASAKPLAKHPDEPQRRRAQVAPSGRWTVAGQSQPMPWRGGSAPPPPSAPSPARGPGTGVGGRRR